VVSRNRKHTLNQKLHLRVESKRVFNRGFETFPRTGQVFAPPFTGYLFLFTEGLDEAIRMGQRIVDGRIGETASTAVASVDEKMTPNGYELYRSYPNPFNNQTIFRYRIPQRLPVQLEVFDVLGQHIASLVNQVQDAGTYQVTFNADGLTSGIYFYRLRTGRFEKTEKLLFLQ